jgi:hypothetical protein
MWEDCGGVSDPEELVGGNHTTKIRELQMGKIVDWTPLIAYF